MELGLEKEERCRDRRRTSRTRGTRFTQLQAPGGKTLRAACLILIIDGYNEGSAVGELSLICGISAPSFGRTCLALYHSQDRVT